MNVWVAKWDGLAWGVLPFQPMSRSLHAEYDLDQTVEVGPLSAGQAKLIQFIRSLDANYRHTFTLVCKGNEPCRIEELMEHRDIDLRP